MLSYSKFFNVYNIFSCNNFKCESIKIVVVVGHYLKPKGNAEFVKEHGLIISKPPSHVIKEEFYEFLKKGIALMEQKLLEVTRKALSQLKELQMLGGAVSSWLVCSNQKRVVQIHVLARDIVLGS